MIIYTEDNNVTNAKYFNKAPKIQWHSSGLSLEIMIWSSRQYDIAAIVYEPN